MKKVITLIFTLLIIFSLATYVFAENGEGVVDKTDVEEESEQLTADEISEYIKEKIAPVVVGVITAIVALLGSINSIKKTLTSLKSSKDILELAQSTFDTELGNIKGTISTEIGNIKNTIDGVPELKEKFDSLKSDVDNVVAQLKTLSEILTLAYSSNADLVRSGKASKMYKLLEGINGEDSEVSGDESKN